MKIIFAIAFSLAALPGLAFYAHSEENTGQGQPGMDYEAEREEHIPSPGNEPEKEEPQHGITYTSFPEPSPAKSTEPAKDENKTKADVNQDTAKTAHEKEHSPKKQLKENKTNTQKNSESSKKNTNQNISYGNSEPKNEKPPLSINQRPPMSPKWIRSSFQKSLKKLRPPNSAAQEMEKVYVRCRKSCNIPRNAVLMRGAPPDGKQVYVNYECLNDGMLCTPGFIYSVEVPKQR